MIDRETGLWIYNKMNEIRDFEETAWTLFTENKLRGSVHLYTGEEAVAASVCAQLTDEDYIASTHRGHGHCIAKGAELDRADGQGHRLLQGPQRLYAHRRLLQGQSGR